MKTFHTSIYLLPGMLLVVLLALSGCVTTTIVEFGDDLSSGEAFNGYPPEFAPILDSTWRLSSYIVDNQIIEPEILFRGTLNFEPDGQLGGFDSCNEFWGGYAVDGSSLRIGISEVTVLGCPVTTKQFDANGELITDVPVISQGENEWFRHSIITVYRYEIVGDELHLHFTNRAFQTSREAIDLKPDDMALTIVLIDNEKFWKDQGY